MFLNLFGLPFIISLSLISGEFPKAWKTSYLAPLRTPGDTAPIRNYRSI